MMIAGAEKSGTSSLLSYLNKHPQVCSHRQREMNFFLLDDEYQQGYHRVYSRYFGQCISESDIILAKSAGLMYWSTSASRLHRHNREIHVVFLLRNPVERAYSAYWFARRRGWEERPTFELAVGKERGDCSGAAAAVEPCSYLERGVYVKYLEPFYREFDRSRLHVFLLEDLIANARDVCYQLLDSLGADSQPLPDLTRQHNRAARARFEQLARVMAQDSRLKRVARRLTPDSVRWQIKDSLVRLNEAPFEPPEMRLETREQLVEFFKPCNTQLSRLVNRDLTAWNSATKND